MYGSDILRGISKVPFEIPHKISDPYIERYDFYTTSKFSELLDLRAHTRYWNAPLMLESGDGLSITVVIVYHCSSWKKI